MTQNATPAFAAAVDDVAALLDELPDGTSGLEAAQDFGRYEGTPTQIELADDGRTARLLQAITYHDPAAREWFVPVDAWLDGASIPRAFWSIIGGPFEGKYRTASIVHDHYCIITSRSWRETHRMFYDAMRCSGVGAVKAGVMYYAVYRFGPRWGEGGLEGHEPLPGLVADSNAASFEEDALRIARECLGPLEIEEMSHAREAAG